MVIIIAKLAKLKLAKKKRPLNQNIIKKIS